jgi:hypothetical protein
MVYEAVEAVALKGLLQRRNTTVAMSHEHQLMTAKDNAGKNELGWGILLWILRKVCLAV